MVEKLEKPNYKEELVKLVNQIPEGKVVYYGQIAAELGVPARIVGFLLSGLPEDQWGKLPWYRVVAKTGHVSTMKLGAKGWIQKEILETEGYTLNGDHVDMQLHNDWSFDSSGRESGQQVLI